jgi:hypothetical protein
MSSRVSESIWTLAVGFTDFFTVVLVVLFFFLAVTAIAETSVVVRVNPDPADSFGLNDNAPGKTVPGFFRQTGRYVLVYMNITVLLQRVEHELPERAPHPENMRKKALLHGQDLDNRSYG